MSGSSTVSYESILPTGLRESQSLRVLIQGARVLDPASRLDRRADVFLADGCVHALRSPGEAVSDFTSDLVIQADGWVLAPGLVDLSARLREPGQEYRATLASELAAAAAGGVTSLCCPPDTDPVLDEPGLVAMLKHRARGLNLANVFPLGALTQSLEGRNLTEMSELMAAGCVGFSQASKALTDTQVLLKALQYANTFGFTVWLTPIEPWLSTAGVAHEGAVSSRLGLSGIPVCAETIALHRIFELVRATGARVHLGRLSSAAGLELVRDAKTEGLPITCDVAIHHVHLIDVDIGYFDAMYRLDPPLREGRDRDAIRRALADGTIDAICSDHTPVDDDAKQLPFGEAESGATGLELLLPLALKWADETKTPWVEALALVTSKAADIVGRPALASTGLGRLEVGRVADLILFDPKEAWVVEPKQLRSQGRNTPFLGFELVGRNRVTFLGGRVIYSLGDSR